jgi:4-amino-4-deoxy-L-arabinose transferase-like glycosyltransferase
MAHDELEEKKDEAGEASEEQAASASVDAGDVPAPADEAASPQVEQAEAPIAREPDALAQEVASAVEPEQVEAPVAAEPAVDVASSAPALKWGTIERFGELTRSTWREKLCVAVLIGLVYLPMLGTAGLWDPWETHYGEVGRLIIERNDWISTWWGSMWPDAKGRTEGEPFFSKPILLMWMMALGIKVFGTGEWGIRIGVCLVSMLGVVTAYQMGRSVFSRRAGALMAAVLGLSPFYLMLGRQAQTDMPFVGLMSVGMMYFMMGVFGRDRHEPADRASYIVASLWTLLMTVPQAVLVLIGLSRWRGGPSSAMRALTEPTSRGVGLGFVLLGLGAALMIAALWRGRDGSAEALATRRKLGRAALGVVWGPFLGILLAAVFTGSLKQASHNLYGWFVWGPTQAAIYMSCVGLAAWWTATRPMLERRRIYLFMFYVFLGLATLAKGLLGFMLPGAILFFYILITREWRIMRQVELGKGILVFIAVAFPWYAAMLIRHTRGFWDRFFVHDHFKRLASGVHAVDEGSFEHFIRWLGYGLFPWSALVPAALARLVARPQALAERDDRSRATLMLLLWAAVAFTLFTLSSTKFHHYIFPVVPPLALLVGMALDDLLDDAELPAAWPLWAVAPGLLLVIGWDVLENPQLFKNLFTYKYDRSWDSAIWDTDYRRAMAMMLTPGLIGMALLPMRNRAVRRGALMALIFSGTLMAYYLLNPYMGRLSETWSQKGHWDRYYALCTTEGQPRESRYHPVCKEKIVAYILNWRGENFYSGNEAIPIRENEDFPHFLKQIQPGETFYVITEMARWRSQFQQALPANLKGQACVVYNRNGKFVLGKVPCAPDDPARVSEQVPSDMATFSAPGVKP